MKRFSSIILAVLATVACTEKPVQEEVLPRQVRITPLITRATAVNFENGDAIGVSILTRSGEYASNERMTYNGTEFSGDLKWFDEAAEKAELRAYYPYSETAPTRFSVKDDQSSGLTSSDLMGSVKKDVLPTEEAVPMVFQHRLAKVIVKVDNQSGKDIGNVRLGGSIPTCTVSSEDFSVSLDESSSVADITAFKESEDEYSAVIVPQNVSITLKVSSGGEDFSQTLVKTELLPGMVYTVEAKLLPSGLKVKISGEIENWNGGGGISGESSVPEIPFDEFEDHFVYGGASYRTVTMKDGRKWMADPMRLIPYGKKPSTDPAEPSGIWYPYTAEGVAATDEESIYSRGFLYDYATALGVKEVTSGNFKDFEGAQGICPEGWHIPARAEFVALCGSSNKAADEDMPLIVEDAAYYDSWYEGAKITTLDADGFNWGFYGSVSRNSPALIGKYSEITTKESNCSVEEYLGRLGMSMLMGSTGYAVNEGSGNIQFFGLMSTFTSKFKEGKISTAYSNYLSGNTLRCIKDAE